MKLGKPTAPPGSAPYKRFGTSLPIKVKLASLHEFYNFPKVDRNYTVIDYLSIFSVGQSKSCALTTSKQFCNNSSPIINTHSTYAVDAPKDEIWDSIYQQFYDNYVKQKTLPKIPNRLCMYEYVVDILNIVSSVGGNRKYFYKQYYHLFPYNWGGKWPRNYEFRVHSS